VSQVHEKLNSLPEATKIEPDSSSGLHLVDSAKGVKSKRRPPQKFIVIALAVVLVGGTAVGIKKWLNARQELLDAQPIKKDPLDEIPMMLRQERFTEAVPLLDELLKANPNDAEAMIDLAFAKAKTADTKRAQELLEKALELKADDPIALNNLGRVHAIEGRWEKAQEMYQKALAIRPEYPEALVNAATAFEATQSWDNSVIHYERFLASDGDHKDLHPTIKQRLRRLRAFQAFALSSLAKKPEAP
jgi:tetratricopeptide (TPR) repeat protein